MEKALDAAIQNPEIVKVPTVQVQGSAGGFEGAAAVLGASNLIETMKGLKNATKTSAR